MEKAVRLLFNLYPGEGKKAFLFLILGLLWSLGSYGTFTLSEGLFLEHVGARLLPYAYLAIAGALCILSTLLIWALNRFSIRKLLLLLLISWILVNCTLCVCMPRFSHTLAFWFLYRIVGWIIPLSTYIIYWAFIDQYFDLQDGKRFFCLFNSITFLGDALGGGVISFCIELIGAQGLLLLFAGSMALSIPFLFLITHQMTPLLEEGAEQNEMGAATSIRDVMKAIVRSPFALYLILFYFTMQLLAVTTEYNYMEAFQRAFAGNPDYALTEFVGTCGMWISLGNMLFAMLCYSRLVKRMGLANVLLIAPSFFLAIFALWLKWDILTIAIFGMIAREGMVYAFDDNHLPLLLSGVPSRVKNQVRITIESFIEPIGITCSALLLLLSGTEKRFLGGLLAAGALLIVLFLRGHYAKALFANLAAHAIRFEKKATDWIAQFSNKERRQTEFLLLSQLKRPDEQGQLLAYEYLLKMKNERLLPHLLNHVGKLSLPGKVKAIELLSESEWACEPLLLEKLERWRRFLPHPAIQSAIHFYFAKHHLLRPERVMQNLHHEHLGLRAAAILTLKTAPYSTQLPSFCALAEEKLKALLASEVEEEICFGLHILALENKAENLSKLSAFFDHPSLRVCRMAAKACAECAGAEQKEYTPFFIHTLSRYRDSKMRLHLLQALENCFDEACIRELIYAAADLLPAEKKRVEQIILKMGKRHSPLLLQIIRDRAAPDPCRLLAGKILSKLHLKTLRAHLPAILAIEIERAYFYLSHASLMQNEKSQEDLTILIETLMRGYESARDLIVQLLGASQALEDLEILSSTLKSKNRKLRATVLESLEKACPRKLFVRLEPLIDGRRKANLQAYQKRSPALSLSELLELLSRSPFARERLVALGTKSESSFLLAESQTAELGGVR
jgi:hypothetical protein